MDDDEVLIAGDDVCAMTSQAGTGWLLELAEVLAACRTSLLQTASSFHWTRRPGSVAYLVATALPSPDPLLQVLQASRPGNGSSVDHRGRADAPADSCRPYWRPGALYETGEVAAPGTVVRGVLEGIARAFWIVGDATDHPEQRLVLAYLEEFLSAEAAKMAAARMGGKESRQYIERARRWAEPRTEILYRFPGSTKVDLSEKHGRELVGERLMSLSGGVTSMFELLERRAGSTITYRVALGMYGFLSNSTHPTLHPSRQRRLWIEHPGHPGERVALEKVDLAFVRKQAAVAVVSHYNALTYVTSYFGWSLDVCETLTASIEKALPGTLRGS